MRSISDFLLYDTGTFFQKLTHVINLGCVPASLVSKYFQNCWFSSIVNKLTKGCCGLSSSNLSTADPSRNKTPGYVFLCGIVLSVVLILPSKLEIVLCFESLKSFPAESSPFVWFHSIGCDHSNSICFEFLGNFETNS